MNAKKTLPSNNKKNVRTLSGTVISDKMNQTIIVRIERTKIHPTYQKRYTISKNYKVHDSQNQFKVGDQVDIVACRPLSRDKRWRVISKK